MTYVVVTLVVLFFLNIYCSGVSHKLFYQSKEASMIEKCLLASDEISTLEVLNSSTVTGIVNQLESLKVTRLVVTDHSGAALYDSSGASVGTYVLLPEILQALTVSKQAPEGNNVFTWTYHDGITDSRAATPIVYYGTVVGCVYMTEYDTTQGTLIKSLQQTLLRITLMLEIIVAAFSVAFSNAFSRRLNRIMASMRIIREGDYSHKVDMGGSDELTVLGLTGIDNMRLNTDEKGEEAEYLLSYLPRIRQETFTVGAVYRHYAGQHTQSVSLSHNYLNNRNLKYRDNDASSDENLMLRLRSVEQKTTLRGENRSWLGRWTLTEGVELNYRRYTNRTLQRLYGRETDFSDYDTRLGIAGWGLFFTAAYESSDKRFTASAGLRADGCDYSARMRQFWRQLSPRLSLAYALGDAWSIKGSAGIYHQLPPLTALGLRDNDGAWVNRSLRYMRVKALSAGIDWRLRPEEVILSPKDSCHPTLAECKELFDYNTDYYA